MIDEDIEGSVLIVGAVSSATRAERRFAAVAREAASCVSNCVHQGHQLLHFGHDPALFGEGWEWESASARSAPTFNVGCASVRVVAAKYDLNCSGCLKNESR